MPKLLGAFGSPFVRKAYVALTEKGIPFEHEQVIPFGASARVPQNQSARQNSRVTRTATARWRIPRSSSRIWKRPSPSLAVPVRSV